MKKKIKFFAVILFFIFSILIIYQNYKIDIPIITYHDIILDGNANSLQVTKDRFEQDMQFLKDNNYTPLLVCDVLDIAVNNKELPENPIMITFDDGYLSNYTYAFPILKQTQMKAVISVTTSNIRDEFGNGNPNFISFDNCKEMYDSGLVDIENHTHDLHNRSTYGEYVINGTNGIGQIKGESNDDYYDRLYADLSLATKKIEQYVGNTVKYFAYPYGQTEKIALDVLNDIGIELAVTTKSGYATINGNKLKLKRLNITMDKSLKDTLKITP